MPANNYILTTTGDGSATIYSEAYGEAMHTQDGAYAEAVQKHVALSGILELEAEELCVLDVGFGLGYNALALSMEIVKRKNEQKLRIISFEKDRSYRHLINDITFNDERADYYSYIRTAFNDGSVNFKNIAIEIIFNDARDSIRKLSGEMFHVVFHDPFSPGKNPELWTVEFFKEIYRVLMINGIVTTYSSAFQVRMAMVEAGLSISRGPSFGKKKESTVAAKSGGFLRAPFTESEITELSNNIKSTPYRDPEMKDPRETILQRRIAQMQEKRDMRK